VQDDLNMSTHTHHSRTKTNSVAEYLSLSAHAHTLSRSVTLPISLSIARVLTQLFSVGGVHSLLRGVTFKDIVGGARARGLELN